MAVNDAVLADPADGDFEDWIELYNPGTDPVDLTGFTLTDDLSAPNKWQFPAGSFIAGRGFIIVWADGEPEQTGFEESLHASFRLNSDGETISLSQANGQLVDQISFGPQTANRSEGRFPDGSASSGHNPLPIPSPNQSNLSVGRPTINSWALSTPETLSLCWSSTPGETYQVQTSDSLQASVWRDTGMPIEATDQTTTATLTVTTDVEQTYYRIITHSHPAP